MGLSTWSEVNALAMSTPTRRGLDLINKNVAYLEKHVAQTESQWLMEANNNESLTVEIGTDGSIVVHGDIDIAGGPTLETIILSKENSQQIVIDLSDVFFIDSCGLRSLLGASRRAQARNSTVILRSVGQEVNRLLQITGTADQFVIESSRD